MADEAKQSQEDVEESADAGEQTNTETQQDKKAKVTFTSEQQAHVNSLIAAERKATERRLKVQLDGTQSALDARQADLTFYEEQLSKVIEAQTSDWDAGMKDLFNALPVRERLEKLANDDFMAKVRRRNLIPKTPKSDETEQPKRMVAFGRR